MRSPESPYNKSEYERVSDKEVLLDLYSIAIKQNTADNYPNFKERLFLDKKPLNNNGLVSFNNNGTWHAGQLYPTHTEKYSDVLKNYGYPKFCELDADYRPLHPFWKEMVLNLDIGGVIGKGFFYHWGANYTADTAVFARNHNQESFILLIQRADTGQWALPGGFINLDESPNAAALRELEEETSLDYSNITSQPNLIYEGPVLDIRTTLHAWIETSLWSIQLEMTDLPKIQAKDDAKNARWYKLNEIPKNLYGSHPFLIHKAITSHS